MNKTTVFVGAFLLAVLTSLPGKVTWAASITIDAGALTSIYSQQPAFSSPISIRVLSSATIVDSTLLNIDTGPKLTQLFASGPDNAASKIIDAYFVDSITFCGGPTPSIVGCALVAAPGLVVNSSLAASDVLQIDLGHLLGHNLGLADVFAQPDTNLMSPTFDSTVLTVNQANAVLLSGLVQTDANGGLFVNVRPVLVTDAVAAPGPMIGAGLPGLLIALGGMLGWRRRRNEGERLSTP